MKPTQVTELYFSPSGNTAKLCHSVARAFETPSQIMDRTSFESRWQGKNFTEKEVAIIGVPTYSGRTPAIMEEFFRNIKGCNTPAILLVSYGNRDYEDSLLELQILAEKKGFISIAGGAFSAQHSFSSKIANGRPDIDDLEEAKAFGTKAKEFLNHMALPLTQKLKVKGNLPLRPVADVPSSPITNNNCNGCMACQKQCPVQAISPYDPKEIDGWRCLLCAKCVSICPQNAKQIAIPSLLEKIKLMEYTLTQRKPSQLFFLDY